MGSQTRHTTRPWLYWGVLIATAVATALLTLGFQKQAATSGTTYYIRCYDGMQSTPTLSTRALGAAMEGGVLRLDFKEGILYYALGPWTTCNVVKQ